MITTYPTFIFMIYLTYGFGIYLFSHGGDRQIRELAEKVVEVEHTVKIIFMVFIFHKYLRMPKTVL